MGNVASEFLQPLQQALLLRAQWLEGIRVPLLKDDVRNFWVLFESIVGTLVKKGLLREDRYEYDGRPTELVVPTDMPIPEAAEADEAGARISRYRLQLGFLVDSFPFTLAALDLAAIKTILPLLSYIDWTAFGDASASPTTRAFARAVTKVRLSQDSVSARVLHESQTQIEKLLRDIRARLAEIEAWHRESWKAAVREKALPRAAPQTLAGRAERTEVLAGLRRAFDQALPKAEWHPELVLEILAEERQEDGAVRRERLLRSLELPKPDAGKVDAAAERRAGLLEAVHSLARVGADIGFAESVLVGNERDLETRTLGLLQRIRRWLQKFMGRLDDRFYDIEVRETPKAEPKIETIDFLRFVVELREMQGVLAELADEASPEHARVLAMTDAQVCEFLDWQLHQLRHLQQRMEGLNGHFQLKAVRGRTSAVRSIRVELLAIENGILRADKVRRECGERIEDAEGRKPGEGAR
jgi:hypothetical protein